MSGLKIPGVGSGFDIQGFVDATVNAEMAPKQQQFTRRAADINVQLSAYGSLKGVLETFNSSLAKLGDEQAFQKRSVSFSETGFAGASANKNAVAGSYNLVVKQLAEAHKLGSEYVAKDAELGSGSLTLETNGKRFTVDIAKDKSSLADIANAINTAEDNQGVKATVVTVNDQSRLVLFAEKTGEENTVSVSVSGNGDGKDGASLENLLKDGGFNTVQQAKHAIITLDEQEVSSQTNEFKDTVTGLTITASKVSELVNKDDPAKGYKSTKLTVGYDKKAVETNLKSFVDAFNKVMTTLNNLTSYDAEKETAGPLNGDTTARSLTSQMRRLLGEAVEGAVAPVKSLTDLGITTKKDGTIELDSELLSEQVDNHFEKVGILFASDNGVAEKMGKLMDQFIGTEGTLTKKDAGLKEQMKKLEKEADNFALYMEQFEARTYKQFSAMDMAVGQMNMQLNSVISAFENMPDFYSRKK
jgi:flagellar hook-associated protein 2